MKIINKVRQSDLLIEYKLEKYGVWIVQTKMIDLGYYIRSYEVFASSFHTQSFLAFCEYTFDFLTEGLFLFLWRGRRFPEAKEVLHGSTLCT